nr:cAMP-regulated phosphoprotein 21-like [Ipomoea trifida]
MATHGVSSSAAPASADVVSTPEMAPAYLSMVDPFLVEALQNPRHRLTILRMELDVQKFLQNPDLEQFEFPHFPTSYLRLAAHRVAQHYGLLTMVDNVVDGQGTRILVRKKVDTKYPALCLSDVPPKQSESDKLDQKKIVLRPRPSRALTGQSGELGAKHSAIRTMEERKEEYDRARARIFNGPNNSESLVHGASDGRDSVDENEYIKSSVLDLEKIFHSRENRTASRVAIFRDREKDLTDPDYDRSYVRYVKNIPVNQSFNMTPFNIQKFQPPYVQYDSGFPVQGQMPGTPASFNYSNPVPNPYCVMGGLNQMSTDAAVNMQWPTQSMMYAHSYEQLRHVAFQAPFYQQPLSFDYSQHHS